MNKKQLLILLIGIVFSATLVLADDKSYKADLDNDGQEEIITAEDKFDTDAEGIIIVSSLDKSNIGSFTMPDHLGDIEFVDLNKDGFNQILARSYGGAHYTSLAIYGYKDSKLYKIFEAGSACGIETDFKLETPIIKIGKEKWDNEGWSYADEPDWEIWQWDGKEFVYSKELSTSIPEEILQKEGLDEGSSEAWIMGRLDAIDDVLQNKMPPKEKAKLLYEKADLMYQAYKPHVGLRELTECIIEAIELDPDSKEYRNFLAEIYKKEWKDRNFHGEDGYSELMIELRNKVESIVASDTKVGTLGE